MKSTTNRNANIFIGTFKVLSCLLLTSIIFFSCSKKDEVKKTTYTITFNTNSGSAIANATINYGEKITKPTDPTKANYSFAGWYADAALNTAFDFNTAIINNTTLYAKWSINTFTIIFNTNGGSAIANAIVNSGEKITKPTDPTRANYSFAGWYSDASLNTAFDFASAITSNTTLYAKWSINTYTFSFESNSGSAVESQTIDYGGKATRPTAPTQTGKQFLDWYADAAFTTLFDFSTDPNPAIISQDTKVYAKWITATTLTMIKDTLIELLGFTESSLTIPERVNGTPVTIIKCVIKPDRNSTTNPGIFANQFTNINTTLTTLTIPNSVTAIIGPAFKYCYSITTLNLPNSLISIIGDFTFAHCKALTTLTLPNSLTNIGDGAFSACMGITTVNFSNSLISIGNRAFEYCNSLITITLPNSLTTIGNNAFLTCTSLTTVTSSNSLVSIGEKAFYNCDKLTDITLPASLTFIDNSAFFGCGKLTVKVISPIPFSLGLSNNSFGSSTVRIKAIQVPIASLDVYKSASGWSLDKDIITGY